MEHQLLGKKDPFNKNLQDHAANPWKGMGKVMGEDSSHKPSSEEVLDSGPGGTQIGSENFGKRRNLGSNVGDGLLGAGVTGNEHPGMKEEFDKDKEPL